MANETSGAERSFGSRVFSVVAARPSVPSASTATASTSIRPGRAGVIVARPRESRVSSTPSAYSRSEAMSATPAATGCRLTV